MAMARDNGTVNVQAEEIRTVVINFDVPMVLDALLREYVDSNRQEPMPEIRVTIGHVPVGKINAGSRAWNQYI